MMWHGSTPLEDTLLLSEKEQKAFRAAGLATVADVLARLPRRHEDRRSFAGFDSLGSDAPVCLKVRVASTGWRFIPGRRYFEARAVQEGGLPGAELSLKWFHASYVGKLLAVGQNLVIYGKAKKYGATFSFVNPEFEILEETSASSRLVASALGEELPAGTPPAEAALIHTDRIVPVYRSIASVSSRRYRHIVYELLCGMAPGEQAPGYDVAPSYPYRQALQDAHFPTDEADAHKARMRFALGECFEQQLRILWKRRRAQQTEGQVTAGSSYYIGELLEALPFEPTNAQKRCVREIYENMKRPRPMNRLLQGDVGSGKTLVALCAMLLAVESGKEAVLMAPTQILAEQHYNNFRTLLGNMDVRLSLRTAGKNDDSELSLEGPDDGSPKIIVGTHALLYKKNAPANLGLAVIDEQHKFGVSQREKLISSGQAPDVLVMTATPIPRTLTLTLYGDLDVSLLDELPGDRGRVRTVVRTPRALPGIVDFMEAQMAEGRQIYIVSPLIDESATRRAKSATGEFAAWKERFPGRRVGLLHGKLVADEKDDVMRRFRAHELDVLVATTVIEVGVDVPNANIMLINDAESFGLSQLHQLRGRIGRGAHASYCILMSDAPPQGEGREKLDIMCATRNGFEIAEHDFRLRGPGDALGTAQSGLQTIRFPEWFTDTRLIYRGRRMATRILDEDPALERPEHAPLRLLVDGDDGRAVVS